MPEIKEKMNTGSEGSQMYILGGKVKQNKDLLNHPSSSIVTSNQRLIKYLINHSISSKSSGKRWLSKTINLLNHCEFFLRQLYNKRRATIILLLLNNKVTYFGQLKRLFGEKVNPASLLFIVDDFKRKGIIREAGKDEFIEEKKIFEKIGRNPIKSFYCLTDDAFFFYSCFEERLKGLSICFDYLTKEKERLSNIKKQLTSAKVKGGKTDFCRLCHKKKAGSEVWFIGKKGFRECLFACNDCITKHELELVRGTDKGEYDYAHGRGK